MGALRPVLLVVGLLATAAGLLFAAQGMGWVHWPATSPMLDRHEWVIRGGLVAAVGILLVLRSARGRRR